MPTDDGAAGGAADASGAGGFELATRELLPWLVEARAAGFVGPGPVERHLQHASGFVAAYGASRGGRALDLGSGGGVPGLALALAWPNSHWVLLDAGERRARFLVRAVSGLELTGRVQVVQGQAEDVAHRPDHRGAFHLVVARGFGPPAVTAECAAGFVAVGGQVVVSEPPEKAGERWPPDSLAEVGLAVRRRPTTPYGTFVVLEQVARCPDRFPRRAVRKRPLY